MQTWTRIVRSRALCFLGRLDEAGAECKIVLAQSEGRPIANRVARGITGFIARHSGRQIELAALCEDLHDEIPNPRSYGDSVAFLLAALAESAAGNPAAAAEVLLHGGGGPGLPLLPLALRAYGYDVLVEATVARAQIAEAADLFAEFELMPIQAHPMASAALARARARLNLVLEQHSASIVESDMSAERASAVGGELYVIRAKILKGTCRGRLGRCFGQQAAILDALGATNRVGIGRELSGDDVDAGFGTFVTARQREVALLVASGLSNGAISRSLGISAKTVEKHVGDLFDRLQVHSRSALAARVRGVPADAS